MWLPYSSNNSPTLLLTSCLHLLLLLAKIFNRDKWFSDAWISIFSAIAFDIFVQIGYFCRSYARTLRAHYFIYSVYDIMLVWSIPWVGAVWRCPLSLEDYIGHMFWWRNLFANSGVQSVPLACQIRPMILFTRSCCENLCRKKAKLNFIWHVRNTLSNYALFAQRFSALVAVPLSLRYGQSTTCCLFMHVTTATRRIILCNFICVDMIRDA